MNYVKRCIGMPGDHIKLVDKRVFINGKPLDEPYVIHQDRFLRLSRQLSAGEPEYVQDPKMASAPTKCCTTMW